MIIKSLLAVAIAAATLNPTPAAEQGMPATSISSHQPASVESSTTRAEVGQTTSPVAPAGVFPVTRLYPSAVPPRPHFVAGYTPHALQRMAQRGITRAQVEAVVASPDPGVYQDDNDTWLINNGYLIVVINKNAWIVTGIKGQM
jgi:hypothetical protein